ncbi:MAG: D-alanine--D-alanine ligase [Bacteroidota bacterium]|nr:D-alanine--D-alanine ligase [Bacteroidota bacterium]
MKNIAVITGGESSENKISLESAKVVINNIDKDKYMPYLIVIDGIDWKLNIEGKAVLIDKNDFSFTNNKTKVKFDCAFIVIHGNPGENGRLQGYFDMLHIPYTASGLLSSALTFNKYFCKKYLESFNILTAKSIILLKGDNFKTAKIIEELGIPLFVKPNNGGSSYGISKVKKGDELFQAIIDAFHYDDEIIIEEFINGRELTCGVMKRNNRISTFPVTEIITKNEFFDSEAKYEKKSEEITPANIPQNISEECQELSRKIFEKLNCKGVSRIDYIWTGEELYFLEINTIPGMTAESIIPKQAEALGLNIKELYDILIEEAINSRY